MPEVTKSLDAADSPSFKNGWSALHILILLIAVGLFAVCDVMQYQNYTDGWVFLSAGNILNILNQVSTNAIIAFGMTLTIVITGIDLSVGSVVALSGVVLCTLFVDYGVSLPACIGVVVAMGLGIGLLNGFIIAWFKIPAFVATLVSMIVIRGAALLIVDGVPIFNDDDTFLFLGNGLVAWTVPVPVVVMILVAVVYFYLTKFTIWGRRIYALGGNEEAALLAGVNVFRTKLLVFALCSVGAAVAGIILASRLGSGQPNAGDGYELDAITACVVGGTNMNGGYGTIVGTMAGAVLIGLINNGMNLLDISPYWQLIMKGCIILAAVIIDCNANATRTR
ncbi:MAG: ABC transporter permease [Planctomycetaceae bacterium]|nr:ABC transporter permease [Planctomycetaceae bacterium]